MQTREREREGREEESNEHSVTTEIYTLESTAKESQIQSYKYTLIFPLNILGDSSTFVLEIAKEKTTIRHAPLFPVMRICAY